MAMAYGRPHRSLLILVLVIYVLGVLPLALLALQVYQYSLQELNEAVSETRDAEIAYYSGMLSEEISTLRKQQYALTSTTSVRRLALHNGEYGTKSREVQLLDVIYSDLQSKLSNSMLISDITLYLPNYGYVMDTINYLTPYTDADTERVRGYIENGMDGIVYEPDAILLWTSYPYFLPPRQSQSTTFIVTRLGSAQVTGYLRGHMSEGSPQNLSLHNADTGDLLAATYRKNLYGYEDQRILDKVFSDEWEDGTSARFTHDGVPYLIAWARVENTELVVSQITPLSTAHQRLTTYRTGMMAVIALCSLLSLLGSVLLYAAIYRPIHRAQKPLRQIEAGDLSVHFMPTWSNELNEMFTQLNHMISTLNRHIASEYQFKLLASDAELKQLQYQISPHFLYNTYFILNGLLLQEDTYKAARLAELIGVYLQYIVRTKETYATLRDEMRHAGAYAQIQQMRFDERIEVRFEEYPEACAEVRVPRLIVQPLIENAFEHGMRNIMHDGLVIIRCEQHGSASLDIIVEDNGVNLTDEAIERLARMVQDEAPVERKDSIALYNIHRRVQIAFGPGHGLTIARSSLGGLYTSIRIPLEVRHV